MLQALLISMDAKRFKTSCSRDAISWLPDEVLGKILSLLPTKQAASTSLLSRNWRDVFRLVDCLDFDDSLSHAAREDKQVRYVFSESFEGFVDRTLALQYDYPIKILSLKCHVGADDERQKACVARWISNVVWRGVFELYLSIKDQGVHFLPPLLFASKTLVKLTIGTQLYLGKLPSYVSLPSRKFLFIDSVFFEYGDLCCVLLAGCPLLEELSVHHINFFATPHTISSTTVKKLSVHYDSPDDVDSLCHMSFDLPKLVYLEYSHCALGEYPQVNLPSLVEAKLDLWLERRVNRLDVTDLIIGIRNVQTLHLSPGSADVIYLHCKYGLPVFDNLVNLSLGSKNNRGWKLLADLLKQSTKLETLIVKDLNRYTGDVSMPPNKVKVLHILGYRGTSDELKQLKSFLGEFKCLELVQVDVAIAAEDDGIMLQTKRDLMMLLGVSLPSKCHFKVT
ncbi:F-box/LRR-repeat protein At3g60040 isoform X1 [Capsella rubella]|uniref:F-box/LRR-repeat protein At3g60040 isoform X1 n=1 Tax=Capsella rubella TaxID=81985 RepID=UPI000CD4C396|nr:F-box/LRR-repeat protein At3g60040 isoform X1 [Capsella rubella]